MSKTSGARVLERSHPSQTQPGTRPSHLVRLEARLHGLERPRARKVGRVHEGVELDHGGRRVEHPALQLAQDAGRKVVHDDLGLVLQVLQVAAAGEGLQPGQGLEVVGDLRVGGLKPEQPDGKGGVEGPGRRRGRLALVDMKNVAKTALSTVV